MDRILVVDGSNLLFQMFYGMPSRIPGPDGRPIQGTIGFVGALLKMIRQLSVTHVAVVFDGECANARLELDENYKANRPDYAAMPEEETPFSQLPDIYAALDHLGIVHRETEDCEADDWMAAIALRYGNEREVIIASWDSDLWQLITDRVSVFRYRGENSVMCDRAYLQNRLGITPEMYADFKALTGDASDNIRGAEKVGPKTAAALLHRFGTLENVIQQVQEITKPSIRASIQRSGARLRMNQLLIRLNGAAEAPFTPEEMQWEYGGQTSTEVLRGIGLR